MKIKIKKIFQSPVYLVRLLFCKNKKSIGSSDKDATNDSNAGWKVRCESGQTATQGANDKLLSLTDLYAEKYDRYFVSLRSNDNIDSKWTVH